MEDLMDELLKRRDRNVKKKTEYAKGKTDAYEEIIRLIEEFVEIEEEERSDDDEFLAEISFKKMISSLTSDEIIASIEDGLRTAIRIAREKE